MDEADNSKPVREFIVAYHSLIRSRYPLMLLMTGLYDNLSRLQDDKTLTFLYRAPKIFLGPLSLPSVSSSYKKNLGVDEKASREMASLTKGYTYAYRVLGYLMFKENKKAIDDELLSRYDQYLAEYVYEKVLSKLSKAEQTFVEAMGEDGPVAVERIRSRTGFDSKKLGVYRSRLIKKGVITSPSFGYVEFSLPRFAEFLKATQIFY